MTMINPGVSNTTLEIGSTLNILYVWSDSAGVPRNLTGWTAQAMARAQMDAPVPFMNLTTENGGIELGGSAGTIRLLCDNTKTAKFPSVNGVWDLKLTDNTGNVYFLLYGNFVTYKRATR